MSLAGTLKVRNLAPRHVSHCFSCCSKHVIFPPLSRVLPVLLSVSLPICLPWLLSLYVPPRPASPPLLSRSSLFFFAFLMRACVTQAFRKPLLITWQASRSGTLMKRDSELETPLEWWCCVYVCVCVGVVVVREVRVSAHHWVGCLNMRVWVCVCLRGVGMGILAPGQQLINQWKLDCASSPLPTSSDCLPFILLYSHLFFFF